MKYYHRLNYQGLYCQFIAFYQTLLRTFKSVKIVFKKHTHQTIAEFEVANY